MNQATYQARCWRDEAGWWIIEVPDVPGAVSEERRLDQVAPMATDAVALILDINRDTIAIDVRPELDPQRGELVDRFTRDSADGGNRPSRGQRGRRAGPR